MPVKAAVLTRLRQELPFVMTALIIIKASVKWGPEIQHTEITNQRRRR